jgi:hypothetical protein
VRISPPGARRGTGATRRAADQHRAMHFAVMDMSKPAKLWWRHSQLCAPNGRNARSAQGARARLGPAVGSILSLRDEGMRRNYLNKRKENRELVMRVAGNMRASASCRAGSAKRHLAAR